MMTVVIACNPVQYSNPKRMNNQKEALCVMASLPKWLFSVAFGFKYDVCQEWHGIRAINLLKRNSRIEIGNDRDLPYVKEILNLCAKIDCSKIGYINSDILIGKEFTEAIQEDNDAFIFSRNDIAEIGAHEFINGQRKIIYGGDKHIGADGFFFDRQWWIKNEHMFPEDLILGDTEWDTCWRKIIKDSGCRYIERRVLFHVYHNQKWTLTSPGAMNNIAIWERIKNEKNKV